MKKRRLLARTVALLYALSALGPGGGTAELLGSMCDMGARGAGQRLRRLRSVGLVRYERRGAMWCLARDSLFKDATQ